MDFAEFLTTHGVDPKRFDEQVDLWMTDLTTTSGRAFDFSSSNPEAWIDAAFDWALARDNGFDRSWYTLDHEWRKLVGAADARGDNVIYGRPFPEPKGD